VVKANIKWLAGRGPLKLPWPAVIDPSATMPKDEPYRSAEAARRLLPNLVSLLRYEKRAAGRRDRAIRKMMQASKSPHASSEKVRRDRNKSAAKDFGKTAPEL
jgi:hypothetical protein